MSTVAPLRWCVLQGFAVALVATVGCVSNSSGGPPTGGVDAGLPDGNAGYDAPAGDDAAASTNDATGDAPAAACTIAAALPDGACNDLQNVDTTPATGTCGSGAQPVGAGGSVVDGTYIMTARALYGDDAGCTPGTQFEATMVITGTCTDRVDVIVASGETVARNGSFATNGNVLTRTETCGATLPAATFTATGTEITIFDEGGAVTTWTKQ